MAGARVMRRPVRDGVWAPEGAREARGWQGRGAGTGLLTREACAILRDKRPWEGMKDRAGG